MPNSNTLNNDLPYLHAFNLIGHFGPKRIGRMQKFFPDFKTAWEAPKNELLKSGLENFVIEKFLSQRNAINPELEFSKLDPEIKILALTDLRYPKYLREIYDPPVLIYLKGNINIFSLPSLSIVGTRRPTEYGMRASVEFSGLLAQSGVLVISGLALGIDTLVHKAALELNKPTLAVLGSGINSACIFPKENKSLAEKIISSGGAIISEYPPHFKARREYFPMRNRIISGLSLGTLVIEAAARSGALITAYKALEQNRSVFALPGSIYNLKSIGPNKLIKLGAKLVMNYQDILEELKLPINNILKNDPQDDQLTSESKLLLDMLSVESMEVDKLIKKSKLTPSCVMTQLTLLELRGLIKNISNNKFTIWPKN